ncbi:plasmid recombination protein [Clostridium botulinum]|nr:plasmid recombination protein [Clostridium botulinum]
MGKYSRGNVFGIQKHNQRENKNYSNENVDLKKTHLNYDLVNDSTIKYLNRVDEIIKKNRTNTYRAVRKDAVVFVDTVVSSDKEFFNNLSPQETRRFFEESYKYLGSKVGEDNIVAAKVHMDENTPHMHFSFVPMNEDGSLSAKKKINRNFLREIQDEFPKVLKNQGFDIERGMEKALKKHLEPLEFKKEQIKKDQIEIDKKILENQKKFEIVENVAKGLSKIEEQTKGLLDKLEKVQVKRIPLSRNYSISAEDYSILISLAKIGESKIVKNIQLESRIAKLENKLEKNELDEEITKAKLKRLNDVEGKYLELQKRHKNLKNVFQSFEGALKELGIIDKVIDKMESIRLAEKTRKRSLDIER